MNPANSILKSTHLLLAGACYLTVPTAKADLADIVASNSQIGAQFVTTDVDYTEISKEGVIADTERGYVPGFGISLSVMKNLIVENAYFAFQFSQLHGETNYIGSSNQFLPGILGPTADAYGSVRQKNSAKFVDFYGRFGKGFELGNSLMATPFVEIGHHNWKRHIDSEIPIIAAFFPGNTTSKESYNNYYYAFGSMLQYSPIKNLVFTTTAMVGSTFSSTMASSGTPALFVTGIGQDGGPGTLHLGDSVFYKVGMGFDYSFYQSCHINASAEYIGFEYGRSEMTGPNKTYYEPDSETNYLTVKAGFGYSF
ncbi:MULTISPECIES: hypothetical protein [Methylomonas]|uniref:hypothetical protein n=1 Tax=Methylomonas TaxID=416 RepID=UPI000AC31BC3|nr:MULTISPECIES: hypothetical protein [Methylomonas]WNB77275.1 hypothetical protein RI210_06795 [Methylomonas koyamae]